MIPRPNRKTGSNVKCKICGNIFYARKFESKRKFCSRKCYWTNLKGRPSNTKGMSFPKKEQSRHWKGGKTIASGGYICVHMPKHPKAMGQYVYEHRIVIEQKIGRYLKNNELVHHKNGIKDDNRPENLEVVNRVKHIDLHRKGLYANNRSIFY